MLKMSKRLDEMIDKVVNEAMKEFDEKMKKRGWNIEKMNKQADDLLRRMDLLEKSRG
jgi:galactokinase/mevalonate kinase-like predicted kinase